MINAYGSVKIPKKNYNNLFFHNSFVFICPPELVKNEGKIEKSIVSNVTYSKEKYDDPMVFNDPYWPLQWELVSIP